MRRILGLLRPLVGSRPRPGGLYSVALDERGFAIVKVLVADRRAVHVRVYSNRYRERPTSLDPAGLFLAPMRDMSDVPLNATRPEQRADPGPLGIGHMPVRRASFAAWRPRLVALARVGPDELEGYETWRRDRGGVFL